MFPPFSTRRVSCINFRRTSPHTPRTHSLFCPPISAISLSRLFLVSSAPGILPRLAQTCPQCPPLPSTFKSFPRQTTLLRGAIQHLTLLHHLRPLHTAAKPLSPLSKPRDKDAQTPNPPALLPHQCPLEHTGPGPNPLTPPTLRGLGPNLPRTHRTRVLETGTWHHRGWTSVPDGGQNLAEGPSPQLYMVTYQPSCPLPSTSGLFVM